MRTLHTRCWALAVSIAIPASFVASYARPAQAGTTGTITGTVTEAGEKLPIAGAKITVVSPSQSESSFSDAGGHFSFVSLAPDEYTLSASKDGYDALSEPGVAVFADARQNLSISLRKSLKIIASVTTRAGSDLVRPGTTADIYSIDAREQARLSALGGGSNLNSAYSAIGSAPGAYVPANQSGAAQSVYVRGGDYYEVGYEFDGIPVNQSFDNYTTSSLSSLGQLELQVYTGATPANAEAQGLAGFVNQVIKTGTRPGISTAAGAIGTSSFYHSLDMESGGATPNRLFSYYVGIGGFNQAHRYIDQYNGAAYADEFGVQLGVCPAIGSGYTPPPSCYTAGALNESAAGSPGYVLGANGFSSSPAMIATRTSIVNLHFGIPHKGNDLRDDVQVLYDNDQLSSALYSSINDEGLPNYLATVPASGYNQFPPVYVDSYQYGGSTGTFLPANYASLVTPYLFPSSAQHPVGAGVIPNFMNQRDVDYGAQSIFKLQYQKNFSSSAFMRLYGYTYYSNVIDTGAMDSVQPYAFYDSGDYEIISHTRGGSVQFTDQWNQQNLLEAQASYTTSTGQHNYNEQMFGYTDQFAVLVNPSAINSGTCYTASASGVGAATPATCSNFLGQGISYGAQQATFASLYGIANGSPPPDAGSMTCGGAKCAYYVVENGPYGEHDASRPVFTGYSLTDQWRPSDRLDFSLGLRLDRYDFTGDNTDTGAARNFWFAAFNQDTCYDTQKLALIDRSALLSGPWSTNSQLPCSTFGAQYVNANMQNIPSQKYVYSIWQPRIGATYTLDPNTVLRASYGKYNEQPSSSYEQYDTLEANLPNQLAQYYRLGFSTPGHNVAPSVSFNSDFSIEHRFKGTDMSFKLTPFLRQTQAQVENFYINPITSLIGGLNAGDQTSRGFEFAFNKGDFDHNGWAGRLSFAYTYATVKYSTLQNGSTVISPINSAIAIYNSFTKACAPNGADAGQTRFGIPLCGALPSGEIASACYVPLAGGGANPSPCNAAGAYANPYWNSPASSLYDPNAEYIPFSVFPGPIGSGVNAFDFPYVGTLILNYKHDKLSVTPSLQLQAGNRYGAPLTTPGIDPAAGCTALAGQTVAGDPRYPNGAPGGLPFDATTCASISGITIPDPYTRQFDAPGAFREPAQLMANLRIAYDVTPRVTATLTLASVYQACFGGQNTPFTYFWSRNVCAYSGLQSSVTPVGNAYNPGANVQTFLRYPYEPFFGSSNALNQPFNAFLGLNVRL
ncbi:MAG: TonB-dependent receptor [Candidatus Baltobacteraceae bacterium]